MKLKVSDLYLLQRELDDRIFRLHRVTRQSTRSDRMLALLVEIGEMINETKCFKYWSVKGANEKAVILEEYGDGIHFLLSLGIDLNDAGEWIESKKIHENLTDSALRMYEETCRLRNDFSLNQYYRTFGAFLAIAEVLEFTAEDIRTYYLKKNQINHQRQDNHY